MFVEVVIVPLGISASPPGVDRVFAKTPVNAPSDPVVIPTYAVMSVLSGFTPRSMQADKVEIVITVQIARVEITIVMIRLDVAGMVKFNLGCILSDFR
jgi:hypothetical protein